MKLKDLLKESTTRYKSMGESDEEEKGMTNAEKREFLKGVSEYKKFGESIYRTGDLTEVYESIKGIVETAHKVTLQETGDWFDKVTVGRHMKSMNESFKVFSSTITEVNSLQQRLESCYDEMGEVLGKYYEIKEGNEFGAERANAIAKGDDEFEVDGKKFPVTDVDKEDKENAEEFKDESVVTEKTSMKLKDLLNETFLGGGDLPSSKLIKMTQTLAETMADEIKKDESVINEAGFATWEMRFADMNLSGVKLSKKNVYKVKARNTVEAIKKAAKMAGVKNGDWVATQTHSLKKIG
tara:strand:+ start:2559 stop:3446 length:888 start_codon:yes stop_codon:yes gene_type:complete